MGKNLYVGNLSFETTDSDLTELFAQHGEVQSVNIITDRETGRPRGFAFVEMPDGGLALAFYGAGEARCTLPNGSSVVLRQEGDYPFEESVQVALKIPAGSKITNVAVYDNSPRNRWNPAPEKPVYWSEQSWDEMYQPTTQFSVDSQDLTQTPAGTTQDQDQ